VNNNLIENIAKFIQNLENPDKEFHYYPVLKGSTKDGLNAQLGLSCYAMKCYFMLGLWDELTPIKKKNWTNFINSFQSDSGNFPKNSFIDQTVLNGYKKKNLKKGMKNLVKSSINLTGIKNFELEKQKLNKTIVAETKQAISTLYMVGQKNSLPYVNFPQTESEINDYLDSFNWSNPWNAGAQFASLCVFASTQLFDKNRDDAIKFLVNYINKKVDLATGLYFDNELPRSVESINGAMKVLTGLEWINLDIHHPEKIIEYCLQNEPNNEGCDLVDIIYVLNRCSKQTDYRKTEIIKYFDKIENLIMQHFYKDEGGFSYFINKSQTHYYGLKISNGLRTADIHGTTLLVWALSLISDLKNTEKNIFKIIKA